MTADQVIILKEAADDLYAGAEFYEMQKPLLGTYFFDSLISDIESLYLVAGIHEMHCGFHRMLASKFPFAIYYSLDESTAQVMAVLDMRGNPAWTRQRLTGSN